ncbi:MAG: TraB/GumN family protein [Balneolales bacterium]|nr:TraB/GumN family protein [Balneolales bacterium]
MKATFFTLILIFLLQLPGAYANGNIADTNQTLLWKIEADHLEAPSYLFGTIHLICNELMFTHPQISDSFSRTSKLVLELDMTDPNLQQEIMMHAMSPDGRKISGSLNKEQASALDRFLLSNFQLNLEMVDAMKPFMISSMIVQTLPECKSGATSYEGYFMNKAAKRDLPIAGLETGTFQATLFDDIDFERQVHELIRIVENPAEGRKELADLTAMFLSQDINGMYSLIMEDEFWRDYTDLLLYSRNEAWIPQISEMITDQSVFFAVGAGHLGGSKGVIQLLREQGYTVTPVNLN